MLSTQPDISKNLFTDHLIDLERSSQQLHHPKRTENGTCLTSQISGHVEFTILSPCSPHLPPSPITLLPGDGQSIGSQKNLKLPSLFILFSLHNRSSREQERVKPKERSGQSRNSLSRLNWASSMVLLPLTFVLSSLVHIRKKDQRQVICWNKESESYCRIALYIQYSLFLSLSPQMVGSCCVLKS